jgi:hypothetical protein
MNIPYKRQKLDETGIGSPKSVIEKVMEEIKNKLDIIKMQK